MSFTLNTVASLANGELRPSSIASNAVEIAFCDKVHQETPEHRSIVDQWTVACDPNMRSNSVLFNTITLVCLGAELASPSNIPKRKTRGGMGMNESSKVFAVMKRVFDDAR